MKGLNENTVRCFAENAESEQSKGQQNILNSTAFAKGLKVTIHNKTKNNEKSEKPELCSLCTQGMIFLLGVRKKTLKFLHINELSMNPIMTERLFIQLFMFVYP